MRNHLTLFLSGLLLAGCSARPPSALSFAPPLIDLGKIYAGEVRHFPVVLSNSGGRSANLKKVQGSCNCLTLQGQAPPTLEPGGSARFEATFRSAGMTGNVSRDILAEIEPKGVALCEMRAQIQTSLKYPSAVNLTVLPGKTRESQLTLECTVAPGDQLRIARVSSSNDTLVHPLQWPRQTMHAGDKGVLTFSVSPLHSGTIREKLMIEISQPAEFQLEYEVLGYVP